MSVKLKILPFALAQVIAGGAFTVMGVAPAMAQETVGSDNAPVQRVEITGSSIRRADAETPSPVQVITSEELKQSGYTSIAQVLGNITANGQGTLSQGFSGAFAAGAQAISLRGMNSSATLVLIDGHRVAPNAMFDDGQRSFVDIGSIPFDTIERIEVLKDGASAQYGSDAMAGVVNIILKKNFKGTTINAEGGSSTEGGGATKHVSITSGMGDLDSDGYNAYISLEYRHENPITNASRFGDGDWTNMNYAPAGGYNWTPGVPNPSRPTPVIPGSVYLYNPAGGPASAANTQFLSGPCNSWAMLSSGGCAFAPLGVIQPETQNINILGSFTKKLSGDWQLALKGSLFESTVDAINGASGQGTQPAFTQFLNPAVGVNGASPFVVNYPILAPSGLVTVPANYPGNTLGAAAQVIGTDASAPSGETKIQSKNYRLAADLTGSLGDWDTSTSITLSRNSMFDNVIGTAVNGDALGAALNRAVNPYSILGNNSAADIAAIYPANTTNMYSELGSLEFHATKSLMKLPGGDLGFSFGGAYLFTKVNSPAPNQYAAGNIPGNSFVQFVEGEQSDTALFAEIAAPVTKTLELDGHARYDRFGLSGQNDSFTPSAGFKWTPDPVVAFRGTLATGFRAPNVAETGKSGLTFAGGNDTVLCPNPGAPAPGTPVTSCLPTAVFQTGYNATPALQPEKSTSATLGLILEPVKGWSSTFDVYDIKVKNQIYTPPPSVANTLVRSQVPINGNCYGATPADTAPCVIPGGANGLLLYEVAPYENTNDTEVRGFELETHYKWKLGEWGTLLTRFDWSHTMSYILNVGGTAYQLAGTHGPELIGGDTANPKDRMQATLTWDKGPWDITAVENYISGYDNIDPSYVGSLGLPNTCTQNLQVYSGVQFSGYTGGMASPYPSSYCHTASFATTDLTVRYKYNKQLVMHFAVNNLFNRQPPFDAATYGGTPYQYNPSMHTSGAIGTFIQAGATYTF
jgi:iron complex outermembrane receptor protein